MRESSGENSRTEEDSEESEKTGAGGVDRRRRGIGFVICTFVKKMQIREPMDTDCHTSAAALVRNDGSGKRGSTFILYMRVRAFLARPFTG